MTIYEIDEAILNLIDQETGEVIDIKALEALEMERDKKISNAACLYKQKIAEADAIRKEKQVLDKRMKADENVAEQLKNYLEYALNGQKYSDSRVSISFRKSESVDIADGALDRLPDEYVKVERKPKKPELKEALKSGIKLEGVSLVVKNNVQIK